MKKKNILGLMSIFILVFLTFAFATTEIIDTEVEFDEGTYTNTSFSNGAVRVVNWTPSAITTALWLDASNTSTITNVSGGKVTQWNDISGNNQHAVQTNDAERPITSNRTLNGLNVIDFDGSTDYLNNSGLVVGQPWTIFAVSKYDATGWQTMWTGNKGTATMCILSRNGVNDELNQYCGSNSISGIALSHSPTIQVAQYNGTSSSAYVNGTQGSIGDISTNTIDGYMLGAENGNSIDYYYDGYIGEFLIIDSIPTTATRQKVEGYLAHKWGLTANLPAGHPYKTTQPTLDSGTYQSKLFDINPSETWELNSTCTDCINITYEINSSGTELSCGSSCTGTSADNITGKWYLNSSSALINFTFTNISTADITPPILTINYPTNNSQIALTSYTGILNYTTDENASLSINDSRWDINYQTYCYQETANVSTDCGGLSTGAYGFNASVWNNPENYFDGNHSTFASTPFFDSLSNKMYVNYTKPENSLNAIWQVRNNLELTNVSIPSSCFSQNPLQLYTSVGLGNWSTYWCYDGGSWDFILQGAVGGVDIYEESIYWGMKDTSFILTNNTALSEGVYDILVNVTDNSGNSQVYLHNFELTGVSYTSINNFDIKYDDFVFGTPTEEFVLMANTTFNLTTADELFIRGMGNIKKQTHTSSANVNARFILNGVNIFEGSVATLSGLDDIVSTKILLDQTYTGAIGENWLSVEVSEDAQGTINITNAEFHILVGKSNAGNNINFNISQQNFNFASASYINVQNFSHTHIYNSTELLDIAHRFTATGTDWPMCFLNNSVTTPEYTRYLSDATDSGSSGLTFYNNITETAGVHTWFMWCSSENAETISNNVTFSSTELKDSAGNVINSVQVDNDSISINSPLTLTAGDNHIQGKEITIQDGNELEFMGTIIVQSISGQQTPNFHIELQNGSTIRNTTQALRQLEDNNDIGTINFYASLDVTIGQTYNVSLHVDVPTGESLNLTDYSIVATEMTSLDITQGAIPPVINIDSPAVNSYNTGLTWINFTYFDANNDIDSCNITTYQGATLNTTINSSTLVNQLYDFSTHPEGVFNLSIGCNDSTGLSDTDIRQINVDNTAPIITLLTPTNASVLTSGSVTFTANVSDTFYVDTINLYGNFSGSWILENTFDATGESQVYNLSETITNGNYIWNIEACDSAGNCAFANNNFTFAMNITSVPYDFGVFGTDLTCPLNETLAFAFGYFAVIGIILLLYFLNLLVIKIPIISLFLGLAEIIVTLNFYGCTWILGTTFTLFGLIMLFYELVLLYKQYFD